MYKMIWWMTIGFSITPLLSVSIAYADVGPPPPTMGFELEYQIPRTPIINAQLFLCDDASCITSQPFANPQQSVGPPQLFECSEESCWTWGSGIGSTPYYRLRITFSDKTRESNVFTKVAYGARYSVTIAEDRLFVREISPGSFFGYFSPVQNLLFLPALIVTLITETIVAARYARRVQRPIRWVGYANMISLPIVWFVFPFLRVSFAIVVILAELFAVGFESAFLYFANRKTSLSLRQASVASVLMNLASIGVGGGVVLAFIALLTML